MVESMATRPNNIDLLSPRLMAQLERLELVSRKVFRGRFKGERRSPRRGQSAEFADFRNYVPGDDLRFVDWNTYARLDRLFLKMFFAEEDLHFYTLIDASRSMDFGTPTKLHAAKQLAAALGFIGLIRSDRVRIETVGPSAQRPAPVFRGRQSTRRMVEYLSAIQAERASSLTAGVKDFCIRNSGKGVVVLISDLLDKEGYADALQYLLSRNLDVYVVHLLSADELDPDIRGDLQLVDSEDRDLAEITASALLLKRYQKNLKDFIDTADEFCTRRGIGYVLANNQTPIEALVSKYLRKRGLVR